MSTQACIIQTDIRQASVSEESVAVMCSLEQRACLIRRGLGERKSAVRDSATALLSHWLNVDAGGSVPSLLRLLDVHHAEEEAEQVVRFMTSSSCDDITLTKVACSA
jgi:hypothetical protein